MTNPRELVRVYDRRLSRDRTVRRREADRLGSAVVVLDQNATDEHDHPIPAGHPYDRPDAKLTGQELEDALDAAGLPKTGTADEKRVRLITAD